MARPLRIIYPGAYYHIMNRGNRRRPVFDSVQDNELFIEKLAAFSEIFNVSILSYCLMGNHFHLYIRTNEGNLSRFMQSLLTSYTVIKNKRDKEVGHIFQGRFKSILVDDDNYGSELSRYIHLNPVKLQEKLYIDINKKRTIIRNFIWSSYSSIIGRTSCPIWLKRDIILENWGKSLQEKQKNYMEFVETGFDTDIAKLKEKVVAQKILGSDSFIEQIRSNMSTSVLDMNIKRELGQEEKIRSSFIFEKIIMIVAKEYKVNEKDLLIPYNKHEARQVLIYLSSIFCRGRYNLTELSQKLGPISVGGVTVARFKIQKKLENGTQLNKRITNLKNQLTYIK